MNMLRRFVEFWIDFIIGDAWEAAAGIGISLAAIAYVGHRWGGEQALGFVLLAAIIAVTWLALLRATATMRRG